MNQDCDSCVKNDVILSNNFYLEPASESDLLNAMELDSGFDLAPSTTHSLTHFPEPDHTMLSNVNTTYFDNPTYSKSLNAFETGENYGIQFDKRKEDDEPEDDKPEDGQKQLSELCITGTHKIENTQIRSSTKSTFSDTFREIHMHPTCEKTSSQIKNEEDSEKELYNNNANSIADRADFQCIAADTSKTRPMPETAFVTSLGVDKLYSTVNGANSDSVKSTLHFVESALPHHILGLSVDSDVEASNNDDLKVTSEDRKQRDNFLKRNFRNVERIETYNHELPLNSAVINQYSYHSSYTNNKLLPPLMTGLIPTQREQKSNYTVSTTSPDHKLVPVMPVVDQHYFLPVEEVVCSTMVKKEHGIAGPSMEQYRQTPSSSSDDLKEVHTDGGRGIRRRIQNREAAQRFRKKKKEGFDELKNKRESLTSENHQLKKEREDLLQMALHLQTVLDNHIASHNCTGQSNVLDNQTCLKSPTNS